MSKQTPSALIIFLSPHGTTKKAVESLAASLEENGVNAEVHDLGTNAHTDHRHLYAMMPRYRLVVFASPTYFHHAPRIVTDCMAGIPDACQGQSAALMTTFGGVSSGVIMFDCAKILHEKKYNLIGGIKVLTEHSMTFQEHTPFYSGHPDRKDLGAVRDFGKELSLRLEDPTSVAYRPVDFRDKPFLLNFIDAHINKLEHFTWAMPRVKVNTAACSRCGLCARDCPTGNITVVTAARHGRNCTYCYRCVRNCPSRAATANLKPAMLLIKGLARTLSRYEAQITQQIV